VVLNLDGYYKLSVTSKDVILTVYPPGGNGKRVTVDTVISEIEDRGLSGIDLELVRKVVEHPRGCPVVIGKSCGELEKTIKYEVVVSGDAMEAFLTIRRPKNPWERPKIEDVREELLKEGVVFGIKEEEIIAAVRNKVYDRPVLVAKGLEVHHGRDAKIHYRVSRKKSISLQEDEAGRVNFKALGLIRSVRARETLAEKEQPTSGRDGKTVKGDRVAAKPGQDIPFPCGRNTEISPDGLRLVSKISGEVVWEKGKIEVKPIFVVKGDVGYKTGNINFIGTVIVEGNVLGGFELKATGGVEVKGLVEDSKIEAGGDVLILNGVKGKDRGLIKAGGNIVVKFVENARLVALKNIIISESVLHSHVNARRRVIVKSEKSVVVGGEVSAGIGVSASSIGSIAETRTVVSVGVDSDVKRKILSLAEQVERDRRDFGRVQAGIDYLNSLKERMGGTLPSFKEDRLAEYKKKYEILTKRLRDLPEKVEVLKREYFKQTGGRVFVSSKVYPGVVICISTAILFVDEEMEHLSFGAKIGSIVTLPYKESEVDQFFDLYRV
jgi:hypothetical protein